MKKPPIKTKRVKKVDIEALEADIMDWFYESIKINFGVDMVQDASQLREILETHITPSRKKPL